MQPDNFRPIGNEDPKRGPTGLQYEFYCRSCDFKWRSPFKAFGTSEGRLGKLLEPLAFMSSHASHIKRYVDQGERLGEKRRSSLKADYEMECRTLASRYFVKCAACKSWVCKQCILDVGCRHCRQDAPQHAPLQQPVIAARAAPAVDACPSCSTLLGGARLCPGCGFDTASTKKSCPSCGSIHPRAAPHCGQCGHRF